jgi:hypothetical protein
MRLTSNRKLFSDGSPRREFLPGVETTDIKAIRFTRLPYTGPFEDTHDCGGGAEVYVVRSSRVGRLRQRYVYHSPDGFEFGYGGSGPADTALNILALFVPVTEAWRLHQQFKWAHIGAVDQRQGGLLTTDTILQWIRQTWAVEEGIAGEAQ